MQRTLTTRYEGANGALAPASDPPAPRPGDRIGRYIVEDLLGTGGMGVVVAARDPELARQVAVKLVRRDVGDVAHRRRLVREARAMARLEHDNVVRVYDAGEHAGEVFVAMELVRGETVGRWLRAAPRPWREVLARFVAAGRGLAAAHRAGLVHRDFKPDNVLVRASDGRVCVTDFGLAIPAASPDRGAPGEAPNGGEAPGAGDDGGQAPSGSDGPAVSPDRSAAGPSSDAGDGGADGDADRGEPRAARTALTRTGAAVGTPAYMAPEQHGGGDVDARADVFGFCVSLYEGLYGERPFAPPPEGAGSNAWAAVIRAGRIAPPPPGRRIPVALRRALLRGLAAGPAERWPDMDALLAALARGSRSRRLVLGAAAIALGAAALAVALWRRDAGAPSAYGEAMRLHARAEYRAAAAAFARATRDAPDFAPAWVGLARARQAELDLRRARDALATALRLIPADDRAHRLEVEGLGAELDEHWDIAIDHYQAYVRFFPRDVEVGLALADAQIRGGHAPDALATVQGLRAAAYDPRLDLAEAKAAQIGSDWPRMIAVASRAIGVGTAIGAPGIVARGQLRRATARSRLRDRDGAMADLAAAGEAARRIGDRALEARGFTTLTLVLHDAGDVAGAARAAEQAVAIDREIGEPHNLVSDLINAAAARDQLGEPDRVRALYREIFATLRALDDRMALVHTLLNYGQLLTDAGACAEADQPLREAIGLARAAGAEQQVVLGLVAIAWNDFVLGNVAEAEAEYRDSLTLAQRIGDTQSVVTAYDGIAISLAARGDRAGELRAAEQALRLAAQVDADTVATERAWYAIALVDARQPALAAEQALAAAAYLHDHGNERQELAARSAAAYALAVLGRRAEAEAQLALGRPLLDRSRQRLLRTKAAGLLARAAVQLGRPGDVPAILAAAPRERAAVPWLDELAALRPRIGAVP